MVCMFGVRVGEDERRVWIEGGEEVKGAEVFVGGDIS